MKRYRIIKRFVDVDGAVFEPQDIVLEEGSYILKKESGYKHYTSEEILNTLIKLEADWLEEIKPGRFRAGNGKGYCFVSNEGEWVFAINYDHIADLNRHEFGNEFETEDQAEEASKRVHETLMKYHEELMEGEMK